MVSNPPCPPVPPSLQHVLLGSNACIYKKIILECCTYLKGMYVQHSKMIFNKCMHLILVKHVAGMVEPGGKGDVQHSDCGKSVNPILIRKGRLSPPHDSPAPQFSGLPPSLCCILFLLRTFITDWLSKELHQETINPTIFNIICWVAGTNDSSTKHLMFQALFS